MLLRKVLNKCMEAPRRESTYGMHEEVQWLSNSEFQQITRWAELATHDQLAESFKRIEKEFEFLKGLDDESEEHFKGRRRLLTLKIIGLRNNQIIKEDLAKYQS